MITLTVACLLVLLANLARLSSPRAGAGRRRPQVGIDAAQSAGILHNLERPAEDCQTVVHVVDEVVDQVRVFGSFDIEKLGLVGDRNSGEKLLDLVAVVVVLLVLEYPLSLRLLILGQQDEPGGQVRRGQVEI